MTRFFTALCVVSLAAGCTPPTLLAYNQKGEPVKPVVVVLSPLCLALCNTQITTAGSTVKAISDQVSTSNTQTQTTSQAQGAAN